MGNSGTIQNEVIMSDDVKLPISQCIDQYVEVAVKGPTVKFVNMCQLEDWSPAV